MVLSRKELGAILLGVAAIAFYLVLLSTTPSEAQNGNGTTGGTTTSRTTSQYTTINDDDNNNDNDIDQDQDNDDRAVAPPNRQPRTQQVINVPNKPLPPSGGARLPVVATVVGFLLTGAGLLMLGVGIRRNPRD